MLSNVFLAGAVRTPIGGFCGSLSEVSAPALGSAAIKAALSRAGAAADQVDEVVFGNVLGVSGLDLTLPAALVLIVLLVVFLLYKELLVEGQR